MEQVQKMASLIPSPISGLEILSSIQSFDPFSTGHRQLDCQLWPGLATHHQCPSSSSSPPPLRGLRRRQQLQVEGPPGSGKTKLVVGIAVRARAASLLRNGGRKEVEVLLIDADGSLHPLQLRRSVASLIQQVYQDERDPTLADRICDGIHLVRITSTAELGFFFKNLNCWLNSHAKVKLVILDSITAHTRYVSMSITQRRTITKLIKDAVNAASSSQDCAVIVTSQLTTKSVVNKGSLTSKKVLVPPEFKPNIFSRDDTSSSTIKPSLSKLWRICLMFNDNETRTAIVLEDDKVVQPKTGVLFDIDETGIYDPLVPNAQNLVQNHDKE